ncbi:MAG: hypothetical protein LBT89_06170 [Planctomycetaceae bacterium]|jgi:hypothetical protein|nr:hypothetical protein [Planctomycetaceae bacterium]
MAKLAFPLILENLPQGKDLDKFSEFETKLDDIGKAPIAFWQYAKVLLVLGEDGIGSAKKIIALLFKENGLFYPWGETVSGLPDRAVYNLPLGNFAGKFIDELNKQFGLKLPKADDKRTNMNISVLVRSVQRNEDGHTDWILRSEFRAALTEVFGEETIKSWAQE